MSASMSRLEEAALQTVVPQLEAEGYQVFLHPSRSMLPPFLHTHQPDALAVRADSKIAIEVIGGGYSQAAARLREQSLSRLRALFDAHPGWELRVVYVPTEASESAIPAYSRETVDEHLTRIEASLDAMGPTAALLSAWAVFEAAARTADPEIPGRPQPTSRLIEGLAGGGYITPDEADMLRGLSRIRSEVAHGRLDLTPTRRQVEDLIRVTRGMLPSAEERGHDHRSPQNPTSPG